MIEPQHRIALSKFMEEGILFDVPMSRHTSLRVGGPAAAMAIPHDPEQLSQLLQYCRAHDIDCMVHGGGFNTLVLDGGIDAVVISLCRFRALHPVGASDLYAEVGLPHHRVVRYCEKRGLAGLEFAVGVPGTVGGWLAMNAGIGTQEIENVVRSIEVMKPSGGKPYSIPREELQFEYRKLGGIPEGTLLLSATFALRKGDPEAIRAEIDRLMEKRAATQPITQPSCGSVFKNPPGDSAGRLIEAAGLKGLRVGGAQISTLHANFIVTTPEARAADVVALIERAQTEVKQRSGVELETEVKILGRPIG